MTKIDNANSAGLQTAEMLNTPTAVTNTSAVTTLFSKTIPGGAMGNSKKASFAVKTGITTGTVLVPTLTLAVNYGGSTFAIASGLTLAISQSGAILDIEGDFINMYATNAQLLTVNLIQGSSALPLIAVGTSGRQRTQWTEDSTVDALFSVTAKFSLANTNASLSYWHASLALS